MILSILLILFTGFLAGQACKMVKLPALLGYLIVGILIGPASLNLLSTDFLSTSSFIRQIALIIILLRTGFHLDLDDLKKIGLPAFLMSFTPALFEIAAITVLAPLFLGLSWLDAAILGCVLAAVSPAVIIPRMITNIEENKGQLHKVPQLIMASASIDDVFAIVLFDTFLSLKLNQSAGFGALLQLPIKLILGLLLGLVLGYIINQILKYIKLNSSLLSVLILLLALLLSKYESQFYYSALIASMSLSFMLMAQNKFTWEPVQHQYNSFWKIAELFLFVVVGASVSFNGLTTYALSGILMIILALLVRSLGVHVALSISPLTPKEKLFTVIAFTPKATVQAALGSVPLMMGLESGPIILSLSVIAILFTAPLGALAIDQVKNYLLD